MPNHPSLYLALIAGLGATGCISALALLSQHHPGALWLMAPFGATMVIMFALPNSPLAHPRNIIGGHLLTSLVGLCLFYGLGVSPLTLGLGVGIALMLMMLTKTTHPPAGANPLLIMLTGQHWDFLLTPVLSGSVLIVLFGCLYHRWVSHQPYVGFQKT